MAENMFALRTEFWCQISSLDRILNLVLGQNVAARFGPMYRTTYGRVDRTKSGCHILS